MLLKILLNFTFTEDNKIKWAFWMLVLVKWYGVMACAYTDISFTFARINPALITIDFNYNELISSEK